jgi:hypothetical protein
VEYGCNWNLSQPDAPETTLAGVGDVLTGLQNLSVVLTLVETFCQTVMEGGIDFEVRDAI